MRDFVTVAEAVELTGYSEAWIRRLAQNGVIQAQKLGIGNRATWLVSKQAVLRYKEEQQQEQGEEKVADSDTNSTPASAVLTTA